MRHFRKIILGPAIGLGLLSGAAACNEKFDDSSIWEAIRGQEVRLAALESLCGRLNSEIASLSSVVNALSAGDMVTAVTPVIIDGLEEGYTISFLKNKPITILNGKDGTDGEPGADGKDGKDGHTPVIGIGKDGDDWYWTLDGEWMRDADGNRLRANGKDGTDGSDGKDGADGKDGRTPLIRIDGGWWCVSYDGGASWEKIGKADEYPDERPCTLIAALEDSEDSLAIRLHDGTSIILPKYRPAPPLEIYLDRSITEMAAGETVEVGFSLSGAAGKATLAAIVQGGWKASVVMAGSDTGQIRITAPIPFSVQETVVLACDSEGRMAMESLSFAERKTTGYSLNATGDSLVV
ncbi:MAG: PL29 family lyase N-terminal domain-containing protein, partial [Candidatus Cryptobacteroides sp.]